MPLKTLLMRVATKHKWVNNFTPIVFRQGKSKNNHGDSHRRYEINDKTIATVLFGSALIGSFLTDKFDSKSKPENVTNKPSREDVKFEAGEKRPDLPTYTAEEVSKHDSRSSFWVTYKHGVYDVTKFLPSHPGGEQILNAGGLSIEPFWNVYGMHKTKEIFKLLESYRIGNLHADDVVDHSDEEMWATEPRRDERLIVKTARPFNAEIPPEYQVQHFDTPNELFYVRQHMPVPVLDAGSHALRVEIAGEGRQRAATSRYTLAQLGELPRVELRAALMCAGNRRSEMNKVKPVKGISWAGGAVSCAVWGGVLLRDVLLAAGLDPAADTSGKHVIFRGADVDATGEQFSTSIPLQLALDERARVLLATHMNGQPLPRDHGAPLRAVVPGAPAVRSVKWLESITVSEKESPSHWHQKDYRAFNPSTTWETAHFPSAPPLYSLPVTAAACRPRDGDRVRPHRGHVHVQGYAYSGGGARIVRVDVSGDRGASWAEAALRQDGAPPREHYAWTLWSARLPVPQPQPQPQPQPDGDGTTEMEIWVKATDSNFNTQPEKFDDIWNIRGILSNAYHKIKIKIIKD